QELTQAASGIPVVFTTAWAEAAQLDPTQYGLAAILLQPFDLDDLFTCVRRVLARHQARLRSSQATSHEAWTNLHVAQQRLGTSAAFLRRVGGGKPRLIAAESLEL